MAAHLRQPPMSVDIETVVQMALSRGYTAQGEMFSGNLHVEIIEGNQEGFISVMVGFQLAFLSQGLNQSQI